MHNNNFDLIRLFAAMTVVIGHIKMHFEIVNWPIFGFFYENFISIFPGVPIFFIVSGYLVSRSFENSSSVLSYAKKRILRIYPGLWVCLILSLLLVGISGYWDSRSPEWTSLNIWILSEVLFGHIYSTSVFSEFGTGRLNGSLWTIPVELQFYILLPFVIKAMNLGDRLMHKKFASLILLVSTLIISIGFTIVNKSFESWSITQIINTNIFSFLFYFSLGIVFYSHEEVIKKITEDKFLLYVFSYAVFMYFYDPKLFALNRNYDVIQIVSVSFVVMSAAYSFRGASSKLLKGFDISYGLYIYHMVWINFFIEVYGRNEISIILAFFATFFSAIMSWVFIERNALKLKIKTT
jgi:peptidoglycan/LPS O-acetylase OafA/YrhL